MSQEYDYAHSAAKEKLMRLQGEYDLDHKMWAEQECIRRRARTWRGKISLTIEKLKYWFHSRYHPW